MSASALGSDNTSPTRFSPITETDHAGYVWIVTIIGITYTAMTCLLRGWIKFRVYGWDDALITIATLLHLFQAIPIFWGLSSGLAKSINITDPADGPAISKAFFAAQLMGLAILSLSKCSVLALMLRVFSPETGMTGGYRACILLTIISATWGVASVIALSADCGASTILSPEGSQRCPGIYDRMLGVTIPDIITDVLICAVPLWVTLPLNMTKGVRFNVALGFSFRIFVVPLTALRLAYFRDVLPGSADPQLAVTDSLLFQQTALAVSLVSATIPNMRTFMKSIDIGFALPAPGHADDDTRGYALRTFGGSTIVSGRNAGGDGGGGGGGSGNHTNRSLASNSSRSGNGEDFEELALRPDGVHHEARISHGTHLSDATEEEHSSINRTSSQDRIITKRMEWAVRHDTG
ncbi:hypothetical protein PGQ11_007537 [Apiospora arundinis]|uniref:Rhodopsin domain-containing protein n=1 Tax=Apiospora arundinis TaxID=335852 RepID=A0ABR2IWG9_9PEZI